MCVTILKVENKKEDDFSMSISSMNSNVANDVYGVKEVKKKAPVPAGAQPREEAPTLTPSTGDTVDIKKDDASATTTSADGSTPPAKAPFPVASTAIGGGVGAGAGGLLTYMFSGEDETKGGKVEPDGDNFKVKDKDKFEADGKKGVKDKATGLYYEIKEHDTNAKIGDITGTPEIAGTKYTYVKGDKPSLTHEFRADNLDNLFGADKSKLSKLQVSESGIKLEIPHKTGAFTATALDFTLDANGGLVPSEALKTLITTGTEADKIPQTSIDSLVAHLKDTLKVGDVVKELKDKYKSKALTDLVHTEGGGGKNVPLIVGVALGVGALGAAAGWFFGRKKPEAPPEAPPVG